MPSTTFYATGTVSVANGGTTVTGVGTAWIGKVYAGDLFTDPAQGLVARVTADAVSDTSLSINPWPGTALSADPYEILMTPDTTRVQERTRQLLEALASAANVGFDPPSGMTADDVQAAIEEVFAEVDGAAPQVTTYTKSETDTLVANAAAGAAMRGTVRAATTANITIATALNNGDALDGVTLATGDLVLVKNQSSPAENGVYVVGASPARAAQFDTYDEHPGAVIVVQEGTANADSFWYCTSNKGGTLGSTAITFAQQTTSIAQFTPAGSGAPAKFEFAEQTTNGTNKTALQAASALGADNVVTLPAGSGVAALRSDIDLAAGFRDRLINGDGAINQRGATSQGDDTYAWDRHYVLTQTAAIGISSLSDVANGLPSMMRATQSQASAQRMGIAQIIEAANCKDLRGQAVALIGKLRCSSAQAIRYAILEWTGTADSVTSDVINSWTNGTFTAGQFFNSTTLTVSAVGTLTPVANTVTDFQLPATLGSSGNNIIVLIWTEGTAAQNVTLDVAWQFAKGDFTGQTYPISRRSREQEMALCQRHLVVYGGNAAFEAACIGFAATTAIANGIFAFPVAMHRAPSVTYSAVGHWVIQYSASSTVVTVIAINQSSPILTSVYFTGTGTPLTVSSCVVVQANNTTSAKLFFEAEL